jgi:hypothetical protein
MAGSFTKSYSITSFQSYSQSCFLSNDGERWRGRQTKVGEHSKIMMTYPADDYCEIESILACQKNENGIKADLSYWFTKFEI